VQPALVRHGPPRTGLPDNLDVLKIPCVGFAIAADDDEHVPRFRIRSPEPVAVVATQRAWEATRTTEDVDGTGLAVVLAEHPTTLLLGRGQPVIRLGYKRG